MCLALELRYEGSGEALVLRPLVLRPPCRLRPTCRWWIRRRPRYGIAHCWRPPVLWLHKVNSIRMDRCAFIQLFDASNPCGISPIMVHDQSASHLRSAAQLIRRPRLCYAYQRPQEASGERVCSVSNQRAGSGALLRLAGSEPRPVGLDSLRPHLCLGKPSSPLRVGLGLGRRAGLGQPRLARSVPSPRGSGQRRAGLGPLLHPPSEAVRQPRASAPQQRPQGSAALEVC